MWPNIPFITNTIPIIKKVLFVPPAAKNGITKTATPISITSTPMYLANSFMSVINKYVIDFVTQINAKLDKQGNNLR